MDDEVLLGMEGEPDLSWDDLEPSEVLPAPENVIAKERVQKGTGRAAGPGAASKSTAQV